MPRWNTWAIVQPVQFDYEEQASSRPVRLTCAAPRVGDVVRVGVSGVELEGQITAMGGGRLPVPLSATPRAGKSGVKKTMAKARTIEARQSELTPDLRLRTPVSDAAAHRRPPIGRRGPRTR